MGWLPDWLTGYDRENAERAAAADRTRAQLDAEAAAAGWITPEELQRRANTYDADIEAQQAAIDAEFATGVKTAASDMAKASRDTITGIGWTAFRAIPLWLWVAAGAVAFFWFFPNTAKRVFRLERG